MSVPRETEAFQNWLEATIGDKYFTYEHINVRKNVFMIRTFDEDGDERFTVWSRGAVKCTCNDRKTAHLSFLGEEAR